MTKLDLVIERLRKLPQDQQDVIAAEVETMLDRPSSSALTDEQRAELVRRRSDPDREYIAHDEVVAQFEKKFGR